MNRIVPLAFAYRDDTDHRLTSDALRFRLEFPDFEEVRFIVEDVGQSSVRLHAVPVRVLEAGILAHTPTWEEEFDAGEHIKKPWDTNEDEDDDEDDDDEEWDTWDGGAGKPPLPWGGVCI